MRDTIEKVKIPVVAIIIILLVVGVFEVIYTNNESAIIDLTFEKFLFPIIILSIAVSAYLISLTEDFWNVVERYDTSFETRAKTGFRFLVSIPGMGLCFFLATQGLLSIYNRTVGEQKVVVISGQIIEKDQYKKSRNFEINDENLGRRIEINVSKTDYNAYNVGDNYSTERKIGALGLIYQTK